MRRGRQTHSMGVVHQVQMIRCHGPTKSSTRPARSETISEHKWKHAAFRNCGLVAKCKKLIEMQDLKVEDEGDPAAIPSLDTLTAEQQQDEI